jgi:type I pantothenate kinase
MPATQTLAAITLSSANLPYQHYTPAAWSSLCSADLPLTLTAEEITKLQGINDNLSLNEVNRIYWPLTCLLNSEVAAYQQQHCTPPGPYIIGIAGSVAAGKSTSARILQWLLSCWPQRRQVDLVTTDGFLYPNRELQARHLQHKKGFPQSYDRRRLLQWMSDLKSGQSPMPVPLYSHLIYDVIPDQRQILEQPEVVILEGLNVLQQQPDDRSHHSQRFIADFLDFSLYIDAPERRLKRWYIERFLLFCDSGFRDNRSHFHPYAQLPKAQTIAIASEIWDRINRVNLCENILPTRQHARLILTKGSDHLVEQIQLRP